MSSADKQRAEAAVKELLLALGQDVTKEGFVDTPRRVAEMFATQCEEGQGPGLDRIFGETFEGLVGVRDIPFVSCCMHHLVFYSGRAHVAYIPRKKSVLGISKLARLVTASCCGFTTQEGVTQHIADELYDKVDTLGCMVVLEAEHGCMNLRGARALGSSTVTSVVKGVFRDNPAARAEFQSFIAKGGPK